MPHSKFRARVRRTDRVTRPGYYFKVDVMVEGEEWKEITVFPIEIRDESGRLSALRITRDMLLGDLPEDSEPEPF